MSLLYKKLSDQTLTVDISQKEGKIILDFWMDFGKFGTDEPIAGFKLTPFRLLEIISEREDITDEELG